MKSGLMSTVGRNLTISVGLALVVVGSVGLIKVITPSIVTQSGQVWYTVPSAPPKALEQLVFGANEQVEQAALNPAPIIPETLQIAPLDLSGFGSGGLYIASYDRDFSNQAASYDPNKQPGFQIYGNIDDKLKLLYEEGAVLSSMGPWWSPYAQSDLDRDGIPELLVNGSWSGTGNYVTQKVLVLSGKPGGISERSVTSTLTNEDLEKMFLTTGESINGQWIRPDGTGVRYICKIGTECEIRQSAPDAVGEITNTFILDKKTATLKEVNYVRKNY